mgnify:CR=1 FL=1
MELNLVRVKRERFGWILKKTSPYELYQFLFNTDDSKVIEYLKKLTFLTKEEIDALEVSLKEDAGRREAQKKLAEEVVRDLHGEEGLESALKITKRIIQRSTQ